MCSGISLTFQICTHTLLAEVLLFFSNISFSFLLLLGQKLSSVKNWENWQKSCGGIVQLGGINGCCQTVPYIVITEWSCQTWQAASDRFPLPPFFLLFPLLPSWKLLTFQATNSHNTFWSFWALHVTNPKITPQLQAIMQSSRYWKLSLFNDKKKVQWSLIIFHTKHRFLKILDHLKKKNSYILEGLPSTLHLDTRKIYEKKHLCYF